MRNWKLWVIAAAFSLTAGGASALEVDCLWSALPEARRDAMLEDYRAVGLKALSAPSFTDADLEPLAARCGVTTENGRRAGHLIGAQLILIGSKRYMLEARRIPGDRLEGAWTGLSSQDRDRLTRYAQQSTLNQPTDDIDASPVVALAEQVGISLEDDEAGMQLVGFIFGRAILDSWNGTD